MPESDVRSVPHSKAAFGFLQEEAAERLFAKIDWSSLQVVSWSEFCTFLHMKFKIKELEEAFRKEMDFCTPVPIAALPHRDRGVAVMGTADGLWISVSSVSMGPLDLCQLAEYRASGSLSDR